MNARERNARAIKYASRWFPTVSDRFANLLYDTNMLWEHFATIKKMRVAGSELTNTLKILSNVIGVKWALVGGMALGYHATTRATQDLDILVNTSDLGAATQLEGFKKLQPHLIECRKTGVTVDVLEPSFINLSEHNANVVLTTTTNEDGIHVASAESLIVLKIGRYSYRDMGDIESLWMKNPNMNFSAFELNDEELKKINDIRDEVRTAGGHVQPKE